MSGATDHKFDRPPFSQEAIVELRQLSQRSPNVLPIRPNVDYYKQQAQCLHKSQRAGSPSAKLSAAQLEVARGVGFPSWRGLSAAIEARRSATDELSAALARRDHEAIARLIREKPAALLDAGCVASPDELQLLLKLVPWQRHDPDVLSALLDAVAEHHRAEGLAECVRLLLSCGAEPFHADDVITERLGRVEGSPHGARAVDEFDEALGVLAWYTGIDEPEDGYMSTDN